MRRLLYVQAHTPARTYQTISCKKMRRYGKSKYVLHGNQDRKQEYEYLRFGSPSSEVVTYLYNKSLEMREVKHKPYIVRQWSQLSYPYNDIAIEPDVWRLEFRLNGDNINTICDENAELHALDINELNTKEIQKRLYSALVNKFWRWAKAGAEKFVDCREIDMFDLDKSAFVISNRRDERQEVRKAKTFIRQFENITKGSELYKDEFEILLSQIRQQLPQATQELQSENRDKSIVSFVKHFMQSRNVLQLNSECYDKFELHLKITYPHAYERARQWAERNGIRNAGDDF